jgi:hypothetical protein
MRKHLTTDEVLQDPLGIRAHSRPLEDEPAQEIDPEDRREPIVNPLWMITAGLALFVILLVAAGFGG